MNPITPPDDGGSAFPRTGFFPPPRFSGPRDHAGANATTTQPADGMTLRDYFAATALAALLTRSTFGPPGLQSPAHWEGRTVRVEELYAAVAYRVADAMLGERRTSREEPGQYAKEKDVPPPQAPEAP